MLTRRSLFAFPLVAVPAADRSAALNEELIPQYVFERAVKGGWNAWGTGMPHEIKDGMIVDPTGLEGPYPVTMLFTDKFFFEALVRAEIIEDGDDPKDCDVEIDFRGDTMMTEAVEVLTRRGSIAAFWERAVGSKVIALAGQSATPVQG